MAIPTLIKLTFVPGLVDTVKKEINTHPNLNLVEVSDGAVYIDFISDFKIIKQLRSVSNIFVVKKGIKLSPCFIFKHKSVLGDLIDTVLSSGENKFHTFKLSCAGADSEEVLKIQEFIRTTYKLTQAEDADMEIFIGKSDDLWEIGVRLTTRPLSLRDYRVANIKGGLNSTTAYAMNTFCNLDSVQSYMNIFSGSGTLLIEARRSNKQIKLIGFDANKKNNSLAIQNIKKAGFIKSIQIKTADIFKKPDLGKFDVITSDLPFGMQISKGEDLEKLYQSFVDYCEQTLNSKGKLVVYTSEHELLNEILEKSKFSIIKTVPLKIPTAINVYLHTKIFVCKLKK